jgi:hypothetical protein
MQAKESPFITSFDSHRKARKGRRRDEKEGRRINQSRADRSNPKTFRGSRR